MREAAERRQQLELEHEQALAVLNAKQKEIELLQKVGGVGGLQKKPRTDSVFLSGLINRSPHLNKPGFVSQQAMLASRCGLQ